MKNGIAVAGSILVDSINEISAYPEKGELTKILGVQRAVGGCVPNVAIDLKRICPSLTVKAVGKIGNDENGEYVKAVLNENGVDTALVRVCDDKTSFTEVMSIKGGERTFFTYAGASAEFGYDDVELDTIGVDMLHLGYLLLLDKIDMGEGEKLLSAAKTKGIKTSIDLVSENSDRYSLVIPCLKYVDNLIINEVEAGKISGIEPTRDNLTLIAERLKNMGVCERVIIHTPDVSLCLGNSGVVKLASYQLPLGYIKGTTGAGDAFCAGALLGIYKGEGDEEILKMANVTAVGSLRAPDAIGGLQCYCELEKICKDFKRKDLC